MSFDNRQNSQEITQEIDREEKNRLVELKLLCWSSLATALIVVVVVRPIILSISPGFSAIFFWLVFVLFNFFSSAFFGLCIRLLNSSEKKDHLFIFVFQVLQTAVLVIGCSAMLHIIDI